MPFTVITLRSVPQSLKGDLTKWMQEIATGVYVGNLNTRVREKLWKRITDFINDGEATMSYETHTELGYNFVTANTTQQVIELDGIPLVLLPAKSRVKNKPNLPDGFSKASNFHHSIRKVYPTKGASERNEKYFHNFAVIDIETTGLNCDENDIIEIGAVRCENGKITYFEQLIDCENDLPSFIVELTGINNSVLKEKGVTLKKALVDFSSFIGECRLVGYNVDFDIKFLNASLAKCDLPSLKNKTDDLLATIRKKKLFQKNYKLETSLIEYGIADKVPHRALEDAKLTLKLLLKADSRYNLGESPNLKQ